MLLFCSVTQVEAQTGSVRGTLYEDGGTITLIGANIYLKDNPSAGTTSEIDGTYILDNIPVGEQIIVFSYTGFATEERTVSVTDGGVSVIDISLSMEGVLGDEVVVTAQAIGQNRAIRQQVNAQMSTPPKRYQDYQESLSIEVVVKDKK